MDFYTFTLEVIKSSAVSTLIGVVAGLIGGYVVNYLTYGRDKRDKAESVHIAIKAEIFSIVSLMEEGNYPLILENAAATIAATNKPFFLTLPIEIDLFTKVYSANVASLGFIKKDELIKIVSFYALVYALVMDLQNFRKPLEIQNEPAFAQNLRMLYLLDFNRVKRTIALGKEIAQFID